jgi:hypothetical protein
VGQEQKTHDFRNWIDREVLLVLRTETSDFNSLVESLPGIYPAEVYDSLKRLMIQGGPNASQLDRLVSSASLAPSALGFQNAELLLPPHPLDYEWRFSDETIDRIARRSTTRVKRHGSIAFVATPSVVGANPAILDSFQAEYFGLDALRLSAHGFGSSFKRFHHMDLSSEPEISGPFNLVVTDPPWYADYMKRFVWYCAKICAIGGQVMICYPAKGTRAGVPSDRHEFLQWCALLGLDLVQNDEGWVRYRTPQFERNALNAYGVSNVGPTWRKGDLLCLLKTRDSSLQWPGNMEPHSWESVWFDKVCIRIATGDGSSEFEPRPVTIISGDVLPSVSRRNPLRERARVWSTGNRVYDCKAPKLLKRILDAATHGRDFRMRLTETMGRELSAKELAIAIDTAEFVARIVEIEHQELSGA